MDIESLIPRNDLLDEVKKLVEPSEKKRPYPLIIGEHGTGKTSLIHMAISSVTKPRGIIYLDLAPNCKSEGDVATAILDAIGWYSDPLIDPSKRNYSSSLPISILEANRFTAPSVREALQYFFRAAHRFRSDYKRIPVFVIDNANRLALYQPDILDLCQDPGPDKLYSTLRWMTSRSSICAFLAVA